MNCPRKNLIYLKQVYTFQANQIKFKNSKSSLPLKRFIVHFLTTLNLRKRIFRILLILIFMTTNLLHVYYVNITSYETLERIKFIVIAKPNKGNGVVILDRKLYNNAIEEIISDISKLKISVKTQR